MSVKMAMVPNVSNMHTSKSSQDTKTSKNQLVPLEDVMEIHYFENC